MILFRLKSTKVTNLTIGDNFCDKRLANSVGTACQEGRWSILQKGPGRHGKSNAKRVSKDNRIIYCKHTQINRYRWS